jgi:pyruvate ferredoxin oxidoreductase alpha subunit
VLDPAEPVSIGAMVGPEAFMEVRYLAHAKQMQALELIPQLAAEFKAIFGRDSGGLVRTYRTEDAETIVVALGSVLGTIKDVVDEMRDAGEKIGVLGITSFRPFPLAAVREALGNAKRSWCSRRALLGGHRRHRRHQRAHGRCPAWADRTVYTVIAGLGGRAITKSLHAVFEKAATTKLEPLTFLDLDPAW